MEERLLALLRLALKYNATDIHFLQRYQETVIEMRVDGLCYKVKGKFEDYRLLRYLQYLANLDVGNILTPQTGQFEMEVDGTLLSLRFALINKLNYSNGVLRILNSRIRIDADSLSHVKAQNSYFKTLLSRTCGLILFSGPTGSGKTTTLYSLLKSVKNRKIYTIEDPIEVYNDEFIQLAVNDALGFDYAAGVRQILRHDPDIIMIGEIREQMLISYDLKFSRNMLAFRYKNDDFRLSEVNGMLLLQPGTQIYLNDVNSLYFEKRNGCIYVIYERNGKEHEQAIVSEKGIYIDAFSYCDVPDRDDDLDEE